MKTSVRLLLPLAMTCALAAQAPPPKILDVQSVAGMGSGWDVDPKNGQLNMRFPLAQVDGDIPIPAVLRYNATPRLDSRTSRVYDPEFGDWLSQTNMVGRPAHATMHFGFITAGDQYIGAYKVPQRFVLEDGSQLQFTGNGVSSGFSGLLTRFGLSASGESLAKASADGGFAKFTTDAAGLGTLGASVLAVVPLGYGTVDATYQVLMDKDRARVFVFLAPVNAWVPVLWADRFGHKVTFKWERTAGSGGFQSFDAVTALNGQGKGLSLRWANANPGDPITATPTEVLRADFIGIQAPSVAVTGYPSVSLNVPVAMPDPYGIYVSNYDIFLDSPFLHCRPTSILIGDSGLPAPPSWAGTVAATSDGLEATTASWSLTYEPTDPGNCRLKTLTEPSGLTTTFGCGLTNLTAIPAAVTSANYIYGVVSANSSAGGTTYSRTWDRTTPTYNPATYSWSGSWVVSMSQGFSSGDPCAVPSLRYTFAGPDESREYANGALKEVRVIAGGVTWSTTTTTYGPGGVAGLQSSMVTQTTQRTGEPEVRLENVLDSWGKATSATLTVGGIKTQTMSYGWSEHHELLAPALPGMTTTTRFEANGSTAMAAVVSGTEWDPNDPLKPSATSAGSGGATKGTTFGFTDGRLTSSTPFLTGLIPLAPGGEAAQTMGYNADGQMTSSTATSGAESLGQSFTYSGIGTPKSATDATGVTTTFAYDTRGRFRGQNRDGAPPVGVSYSGETSRTTTQDGVSSTETFDAFGRLLNRSISSGVTETYSYDLAGRLTSVRQEAGGSVRTRGSSADPLGRPTYQSSEGANNQLVIAYAALGRNTVVTATGGAGATRIEKDPWGQVVSSTDIGGVVTTTTFNAFGQATSIVQSKDGASQTRNFGYNPLGFLESKVEPETGTTLFYAFTMGGQPTFIQEAGGRSRTLSYDGFGRLTSVSGGATDSLTYGYAGPRLSYAIAGSAAGTVRQDYTYGGPGGAMDSETTRLNGSVLSGIGYGFDAAGHLSSITYPSRRIVGYQWNGGRVIGVTVTVPGGTEKNLAGLGQDAWGNLTSVTFDSGAKSEWLYNAIGASLGTWKVTEAGATTPLETRTYGYDANMNLNGVTPDWVSLTHDAKGQLTNAQGYGNTLGFSHDSFGNNTSATTNLTQGPDWLNPFTLAATWANNRLPGPLAEAGKWTGWDINARGEATLVGTKLNSNVAMTPQWDGLGRLFQIDLAGANQGYLYAPSGMRVQVTDKSDPTRSRRYGYTSAGMLLSEFAPALAGHASSQAVRVMHATSGAGALSRNLGSFAAGDTVAVTVWFKAAAGVSGALAIHDGRPGDPADSKRFVSMVGNGAWQQLTLTLTLGRADTLWVHFYGDMYTPTSSNASGSTFVDYDDLRITKNGSTLLQDGFESGLTIGTDPLSQTGYYACAAGLASLQTASGVPDAWKRDVIYAGGRAIAEIDAEGIHELHTDHLGSPRVITAGSNGMTEVGIGNPVARGHVEARQAFAPYGERVTSGIDPSTTRPWTYGYKPLTGYTGHVQQDATGLIYMRGRYYSPAWHRFLNSDQGVDPMQFNQFAYVAGSPLQATDPSGMTIEASGDCKPGEWYIAGVGCVPSGWGGGSGYALVDGARGSADPFSSGTNSLAWFDLQNSGGRLLNHLNSALPYFGVAGFVLSNQLAKRVSRSKEQLYKDCIQGCIKDAGFRASVGIAAGFNPIAGVAWAAIDIKTGGINPFSYAMNTAPFQDKDFNAWWAADNTGAIIQGAQRLSPVSAAKIGAQLYGFGEAGKRAGAAIRAGNSVLARSLPVIGPVLNFVQGAIDISQCDTKCAVFK